MGFKSYFHSKKKFWHLGEKNFIFCSDVWVKEIQVHRCNTSNIIIVSYNETSGIDGQSINIAKW